MNILPAIQAASEVASFVSNLFSDGGESRNAREGQSFYDALRQAGEEAGADAVRSPEPEPGQDAAQQYDQDHSGLLENENYEEPAPETQQYAPLEAAPATPHSTDGVQYQLDEVSFTQQELARLRDEMLKEGLDQQSLTVIEQLASHPHGATLGQLLALMNSNMGKKTSLSDSDKMGLQSFADKIDPSGALGKNMLHLLENGRNKEAWDAIASSLAALDPQSGAIFAIEDAALLCKTFGVGRQAGLDVLKQFGNAESLPLTSDIFTALMMPAQHEILNKAQQNDKLGAALAKHLQPLINEARQRSEKERQAADGADRKSRQSETLIRDKFMDSFRRDVAGLEDGEAGKRSEMRPAREEALAAHEKIPTAMKSDDGPAPKKSDSGVQPQGRNDLDDWRNFSGKRGNADSENNQNTRRDGNRESLFSRIEVRQHAHPANAAHSAFTQPVQPQEQIPAQNSPAPVIRQALQQVEQGALSKLANGGQRLELQLAPSELGAVTLVLTSGKNGEISATIRSERSETAELVTRHLDMIRVSLEEQGLKVDKLEVQNQMLGNHDEWQGADQHNAMREEQERRDVLERLRRLGRQGEQDASRARDMQNNGHTAEISGQGLHLVA